MTVTDTPIVVTLDPETEEALGLLRKYTSERQEGDETTTYGRPERFPYIRLAASRSMIMQNLDLTETKARAVMRQAELAGEVVVSGNASAKTYRLKAVEDEREKHFNALDARCRDLVIRLNKFGIKADLTGPSVYSTYGLDYKGRATGVRIDGLDNIEEKILYLLEAGSAASAD